MRLNDRSGGGFQTLDNRAESPPSPLWTRRSGPRRFRHLSLPRFGGSAFACLTLEALLVLSWTRRRCQRTAFAHPDRPPRVVGCLFGFLRVPAPLAPPSALEWRQNRLIRVPSTNRPSPNPVVETLVFASVGYWIRRVDAWTIATVQALLHELTIDRRSCGGAPLPRGQLHP